MPVQWVNFNQNQPTPTEWNGTIIIEVVIFTTCPNGNTGRFPVRRPAPKTRELMKRLSLDLLKSYYEINDPICISIYMPTHRKGREMQQDQIRFKNLLANTEDDLKSKGLRKAAIDKLLKPVSALRMETPLWQHMSDGFVIFRSENHFSYNQFPVNFDEGVYVQHRFHIKPLIPLLTGNGLYYVLGFSQNNVRLFEGTRFSLTEIESGFLPDSLQESLNIDEFLRNKQFHTGTNPSGGERSAIFHGHGGADEGQKDLIRQFAREINRNLTPFLTDRQAPLVVAAVEYLHPIYREVNDHAGLIERGVYGNPDGFTLEELHQKSWEAVSAVFEEEKLNALKKFSKLNGSPKSCTTIEDLLKAAHAGRVENLFIALDEQVEGFFDPDTSEIKVKQNGEYTEDLLDLCSIKTLLNGGTVFGMPRNEIPGGFRAAGTLRY